MRRVLWLTALSLLQSITDFKLPNENTAEKILMHYEVRIRGLWKFPKPKIEFTILGIRNSENCTHI